jgi:hypothetical protein
MSTLQETIDNLNGRLHQEFRPMLVFGLDAAGNPVTMELTPEGKLTADAVVTQSGPSFTLSGDAVTIDRSVPEVEVYQLRVGGLTGDIVQRVRVTYATADKDILVSVERLTP